MSLIYNVINYGAEGRGFKSAVGSTGSLCQPHSTIIILNIGTDRSEQTVQTQIRLLLTEQSD